MSQTPERELAFEIHFSIKSGVIRSRGTDVGAVTGSAIIPLRATFTSFPPPGSYNVDLQVGPGGLGEVLLETIGSIDADALVATLAPPPPMQWEFIPEECFERLELDAELEFESVQTDDEWHRNEPADIDAARTHFEGRWKLTVPFPLGFGIARSETQVSLDRRDYELDGEFAGFQKLAIP